MTRKQKAKQKRNQEIVKLSKTLTIEEISAKFNLTIPTIYRILQYEN